MAERGLRCVWKLDSQPLTLWLRDACEAVMYRPRELSTYRCVGVCCSCLYTSTSAVLVNLLFVWLLGD